MPLNHETVEDWIEMIEDAPWWRKRFEMAAQMHQRLMPRDTNGTQHINRSIGAILIGSHAWDLLAMEGFKGNQSHVDGIVTLVKFLQEEYPYMDVILKSPFAMHIHIPMSKNTSEMMELGHKVDKRHGDSDPVQRLKDRLKYMSESRVRYVEKRASKIQWFSFQCVASFCYSLF
jgi:hypothetical protein